MLHFVSICGTSFINKAIWALENMLLVVRARGEPAGTADFFHFFQLSFSFQKMVLLVIFGKALGLTYFSRSSLFFNIF